MCNKTLSNRGAGAFFVGHSVVASFAWLPVRCWLILCFARLHTIPAQVPFNLCQVKGPIKLAFSAKTHMEKAQQRPRLLSYRRDGRLSGVTRQGEASFS